MGHRGIDPADRAGALIGLLSIVALPALPPLEARAGVSLGSLADGFRYLGTQRVVLAFRCSDAADVDATYMRIIEAGFESKREPWDAFWGQRFAYLLDPDGNTVALFAPLE